MDAERWHRIDVAFHTALAAPPEERAAALEQACEGDVDLLAEVQSLISVHERGSSVLDSPAFDTARRDRAEPASAIAPRPRIGHYALRDVIGRGGMGVVYEAEQDSPRRVVALKVMRALPYLDELTPRLFEREGQALARLTHPGIAAIYEAGRTTDGWYYFAMERVLGVPLTDYAREHELTLRERLELFIRVCEAVHYAHQRGVIHRDLKPSNILVAATPGMAPPSKGPAREIGQPKILDFGLARITDPGVEYTRITQPGVFHGTLAYASPEQARGDARDVDTRSDVYSLGVVLYELLTGHLPYELRGKGVVEAARIIANQRPAALRLHRRDMSEDVETIVQKALAKDPSQRYASVDALADDVRCYLANRPILAHRASAIYQLRKFLGRNRIASATVGALLVGLIALAVANGWVARRYADERDAAKRAAAEERKARHSADEVVRFLESVLAGTDPFAVRPGEASLRGVVDYAESRLSEFQDEPLVQARVMTALARVDRSLANYDRARGLLDRVIAVRRSLRGADESDVAEALIERSAIGADAGDLSSANEDARAALAIMQKVHGRRSLESSAALEALGAAQFSNRLFDAARVSFAEALDIRRALLGSDDPAVADSLSDLGQALREAGSMESAIAALRESLRIRERRFGDSPQVCDALLALALATYPSDREATAKLLTRRLEVARRIYPENHPAIANALHSLAFVTGEKDAAAACRLYSEELEIRRRSLGPDHPLVADTLNDLGNTLKDRGDIAGAVRAHEEALRIRRKHFGEHDRRVANSMNSLAVAYHAAGKLRDAVDMAEKVLPIWIEIYGPKHAMVGVAHQNLAAFLIDLGDWHSAEEHLRAAGEIYAELRSPKVADVMRMRANLEVRGGRFTAAEDEYRKALGVLRSAPDAAPGQLGALLNELGTDLDLQRRATEAKACFAESLATYRTFLGPADATLISPIVNLAEIQLREGESPDASLLDAACTGESKLPAGDSVRGDLLALRGLLALSDGCPEDAVDELREALAIHEAKWGTDSWRAAITRARLGRALLCAGHLDEAGAALSQAASVLKDLLGADHPVTVEVQSDLARLEGETRKPSTRVSPAPARG